MTKYLRISSYMRKPFLEYNFATDPYEFLYMWGKFIIFLSVYLVWVTHENASHAVSQPVGTDGCAPPIFPPRPLLAVLPGSQEGGGGGGGVAPKNASSWTVIFGSLPLLSSFFSKKEFMLTNIGAFPMKRYVD